MQRGLQRLLLLSTLKIKQYFRSIFNAAEIKFNVNRNDFNDGRFFINSIYVRSMYLSMTGPCIYLWWPVPVSIYDRPLYPGNQGLKDQLMVLRWVRANIDRFGGNPDKVTLMGEDSGAAAITILTMSPLAQVEYITIMSPVTTSTLKYITTQKKYNTFWAFVTDHLYSNMLLLTLTIYLKDRRSIDADQ